MSLSGGFTMRLYGSDTNCTASIEGYPTKTDVEALSDVKYIEMTTTGAYPEPELEGDTIEFISGFLEGKRNLRLKFSPEYVGLAFPGSTTSLDDFYGLPLFAKAYKYLWLGTAYNLVPEEIKVTPSNYCILVIVESIKTTHEKKGGLKTQVFELKRAF